MPWKDSGADREWNDDDLAETAHRAVRRSRTPGVGNRTRWTVAAVVIALLAANLVAIIAGDIRQSRRLAPLDLRMQALATRIDRLETQQRAIADIQKQLPDITEKAHRVDLFMGRFEAMEAMVAKRFGDLSGRLQTVERQLDQHRGPAPRTTSESRPSALRPSGASKTTHTVARGETLFRIAQDYHTSVSQLQRLNGLSKSSEIHPGQILKVR